jgi:DNA-binding transcriptional LysR family regulator
MHPTPRADDLIGIARTALVSLRQLASEAPAFDPHTVTRKFRICMADSGHITMLPVLLARVRELAPRVRLEAAGIGTNITESLQSGAADLAIGLIPELEAGFYQQALFTQDWLCVTKVGHPRIGRTLSLKQYRAEQHLSIGLAMGQLLLGTALKSANIERDVILELPGFLGVSAILSSTDLIATLPRRIGERLASIGNLQTRPCPVPIPSFTVRQHWHARYHNDPGNRWLRGLCAQLFLQRRSAPQLHRA